MARLVAVAGGTGSVARDVIDQILSRGVYTVVVLSRKESVSPEPAQVQRKVVDYEDKASLVQALEGVDTLLSFLATADVDSAVKTQRLLIDAAIEAGVRRFAPSEWAARSDSGVSHYAWKDEVRKYLEEINRENKRIQYCLFQPGFFVNYFAFPHKTATNFHVSQMFADFEKRRAIIMKNSDFALTLTTVEDMCRVVALALEYQGEWPTIGGMEGTRISILDFLSLGEKIRGPFQVEEISKEDIVDAELNTSWYPAIDHPQVPEEMREQVSKHVLREYLLSLANDAWTTSDEWNKLLPDFMFTSAEEYLQKVWGRSAT